MMKSVLYMYIILLDTFSQILLPRRAVVGRLDLCLTVLVTLWKLYLSSISLNSNTSLLFHVQILKHVLNI